MKRALLTGGSNGLGRALADLLLQRGYQVVSVDRSGGAAQPAMLHVTCDLADRHAVDRTLPAILAAGPYELAIFNAGASATGRFEDIPLDACLRLLAVNAETPLVFATALMQAGAVERHLCFISSLSHFTGYPGAAVYAASKDVVAAYAKGVRKPFAAHGVSVTLACPGPIRTAQAERHAPPGADAARRMPPEQAARAILDATLGHRRLVIPGAGPKLFALAGWLFPAFVTRQMKRLIFDRLDEAVW
ncbi:MAG: SDR family NAD(P)-dependent oxidoreductase [Mesorhizobium sp.]|nr:SDR family NAD(P)-dependent oxidoreductase [Mesorhizobium sp.]